MAHPVPLHLPGPFTVLRRALALRCPRCGQSRLYRGWFAMQEACAVCGYRYEREQGYWVGAIYVNFAATVVLGLGPVLALDLVVGLTLGQQLALAVPLVLLVPVAFFRYARSLWLGLDYLVTSRDERPPRRRASPPSR